MHQIRIHLASIGHPVLGDKAYGDKSENSFAKRRYKIDRQLLHAKELHLMHPKTKKRMHFIAPLKSDMEEILCITE